MIDELGLAWRTELNPVEVRTEDGTVVRSWTRAVPGGARPKQSRARWVFEAAGRQSIGPVADPTTTIDQLQSIVDAWWQREKRDRAEEKQIVGTERPRSPSDTPIVIITNDGSVFRCTCVGFPWSRGSGMLTEARWVFTGANGRNHIGPSASTRFSREELRGVVEDWWAAKKGLLSQV